MFSSRLPGVLTTNAVTRAVAARRASGAALVDLTETNPTAVGLPYPPGVLSPLGHARAMRYAPDPRGLIAAREAVLGDAGARWPGGTAESIVLTASTSEAYAVLFKLLCEPGDQVLVPQPSYPLFDLLTALEAVEPIPYRLQYHGAWSIDRASLERAITPRTRAVLVVSPNNPTGSRLRADDRDWLASICGSRGLPIISDEVFFEYPLAPRPDAASFAGETRTLTFVLGGLSKSAGLPQVKLAWMLVGGPPALAREALDRLDVICDCYLSVSTPVQMAAAELIAAGRGIRRAIQARLEENLSALRHAVSAHPAVSLLEPEGGWSVVLRVPSIASEEAIVVELVEAQGVLVHPGYFFDFAHEAFLVLSLLPEPAVFADAAGRVLATVSARS